jgi:hypothetical protein
MIWGDRRRRTALKGTAPGILFLYLLDAILLTVPVSLVLIWLYRRTVERAMHAASAAGESATPFHVTAPPRVPGNPADLWNRERLQRLRLGLVYAVAGASAAAVWTWLYFRTPDLEFTWLRGFAVWYVYCWPVTATIITLLAIPWRRSLWVVAGYLTAGMLMIVVSSTISHLISGQAGFHVMANLESFIFLLALEAAVPALIILVASNRRIRGVSPLALVALLIFTFSSIAAREIFVTLLDAGGLRKLLLAIGPNWWFMFATVPVGYLCWRLLSLLNIRYRRKSFSDVQLVVDLYWMIVAFVFSAQYASSFGWKGIIGLAGFVAYRAVAQAGLAMWPPPHEPGTRLLILRVFGFRGRTEKLFDSVAQRWRFRGGVAMIAGTDLAARTIDPDDTLAFLAGDLRSRFVQGQQNLEEHLNLMDGSRDPDGRYRITEFFCHENTWSGALASLLGRSDAILMDLRGFSEKNSGCIFELRQLTTQQRLDDTVFVVDTTTDINLLERTIGAVEGKAATTPSLRLEKVESGTTAEGDRVYRSLCPPSTTLTG